MIYEAIFFLGDKRGDNKFKHYHLLTCFILNFLTFNIEILVFPRFNLLPLN